MAVKTRNLIKLRCGGCQKINYYYWKIIKNVYPLAKSAPVVDI